MSGVAREAVLAHSAAQAGEPWSMMATIIVLCGLAALYGCGVQNLWQRRGTGAVISVPRAVGFGLGLAAIGAADSSPVAEFAAGSFAGHMAQHMLLVVVVGPLLGAGGAALPLSLALPHRLRRVVNRYRAAPFARWLRRPAHRLVAGGLVFTGVLWVWHLPSMFAFAERVEVVHAVEHLSFVVIAWMLWAAVLSPDRHRLTGPLGFLLLFVVGMTSAALGAVLTFAPQPLYPSVVYGTADPLADQQLAGLVMWIPMDVVLLGFAVHAFGRWLTGMDGGSSRDEVLVRPGPVPEGIS